MTRAKLLINGAEFRQKSPPTKLFTDLWLHRSLLLQLISRDIAGRYRGSLFGSVWAFFNPLLMLLLYTMVFGVFLQAKWGGAQDTAQFSLVLFAGLLVFNFFSECLNRSPGLINSNVNLVKKVAFPLEILPWMMIGTALFHTAISLLVWVLFAAVVYHQIHWTIAFLPLVMLPLVFITLGVCWIISSLGVYVRDIGQLIGVFTSFIMFMSPIFYPVESLPKAFQAVLNINPLTFVIQQARSVMIDGRLPDFAMIGIFTLASMVFAWLALVWFQRAREGFADVL